jgi:hypothetical protein
LLDSNGEGEDEKQESEDQIHRSSCDKDQQASAYRFFVKLVVGICSDFSRFFTSHFYVSTQGDEADDIFGSTVSEGEQPSFPAKDGRLETNRECFNSNTDKLGSKEMAKFVNEDEKTDSEDGEDDIQVVQLLTRWRVS